MSVLTQQQHNAFVQHQLDINPFLKQHDDVLVEALASAAIKRGVTVEQALAEAARCERVRRAIGGGEWLHSGGQPVSAQQHRQLWLNYLTALRTAELG